MLTKTGEFDEMTVVQHEFLKCSKYIYNKGFPGDSDGKESACNAGNLDSIPGSGRSPGEDMVNHSSILAWRLPWTEQPEGLSPWGCKESDRMTE